MDNGRLSPRDPAAKVLQPITPDGKLPYNRIMPAIGVDSRRRSLLFGRYCPRHLLWQMPRPLTSGEYAALSIRSSTRLPGWVFRQ